VDSEEGLMTEGIVELVPERLYRLGSTVEADRRVSWLPPGRDGYEAMNVYLLLEDGRGLMIDTGVAVHGRTIVRQVGELLPPGAPLSVFMTRLELDCLSNLGRLAEAFGVQACYAGGRSNPFDFFDDIESSTIVSQMVKLNRVVAGEEVTVSGPRGVRLVATKLRLLSTNWGYDEATGTLFTSDSFSYLGLREPGERPLANGELPTADEVYEHMTTKFGFLPAADTTDIRAAVRDVFERHEVTTIAPGHGRIIRGADAVREHVELVDEALSMCGKELV
jgi:glyoxylase-like metal-dependent hydrolase (beta-lactamase superfamily II)